MTMIGGTIATDDRSGMGMAIATVTVTASTVTETKPSYFLLCKSRRNFSKNGGAIIVAPFFLIGAAHTATGFALQPNSPATKTSRNRLKEQLDALN
jgi:hypothetical protein